MRRSARGAATVNRVIAQVVDGRADLLVRGGDRMALAGTLLALAREPGIASESAAR